MTSPTFQVPGAAQYGADPDYEHSGFLPTQHAVNRALMQTFGNPSDALALFDNLKLNRFPYPAWSDQSFSLIIRTLLPLLLMIALFYTALCITRSVVAEKESGIRETLKMMGVQGWMQWLAWFTQYFLFLLVSIVLICAVASLGNVFENTDGSLFFVFLLLFAIASINLMFLISVFFNQATTAAGVAGLIWFCSWLPYKVGVLPHWQILSNGQKTASCLISTTCMSIGANVIGLGEASGEGVKWSNMYKPISVDDSFTFATVLHMLLVDIVLYGGLTLYLDAVFPGKYGVAKPWHFVFTGLFACFFGDGATGGGSGDSGTRMRRSNSSKSAYSLHSINGVVNADPDDDVELLDDGGGGGGSATNANGNKVGIEIRKLRKVYKTNQGEVVAVNDNTLSMFEGQVTALLGHNGAGKTTTMSILSGMTPPTAGTAIVNGHDITTNLSSAQASIGFCPQHNSLFDNLTVAEHLWFFCKLKLVSDKHVYRFVDEMVADLELLEKRHAQAKTLSGGMKRKLSCGVALVGGSPVVILDEPTSGCDPSARRAIWDLLIKNKPGRTMLLSTHFMDEADVLGDRIAIMVNGRVECVGSPMELKSQYGIGYHLTVVKQKGECNAQGVLQVVQTHIPAASLKRETGAEMTLVLPREAASKFPTLFEELEHRRAALGFESFGVSVTTIEEVFLKVGEDDVPTAGTGPASDGGGSTLANGGSINGAGGGAAAANDTMPLVAEIGKEGFHQSMYLTGMKLKIQHFQAMWEKRWLNMKRNRWAVLTQLVVPLIFVILALGSAKNKTETALPSRNVANLSTSYGPFGTIVYGRDSTTTPTCDVALSTSFASVANVQQQYARTVNLNAGYVPITGRCANDGDCMEIELAVELPSGPADAKNGSVANYNRHNMVALSESVGSDDCTVTAWFNGEGYHAGPQALALASNVILGSSSATTGKPRGSIVTSNNPFPRSTVEKVAKAESGSSSFTVALLLMLGMSFFGASFVDFVVAERASKAKHMQFLGGVGVGTFWGSAILFDLLNFVLPVILLVAVFAGFNVEAFAGPSKETVAAVNTTFSTPHVQLGNVALLLLAYGVAVIPLSYFVGFFFSSPAVAYNRLLIFNVLTGVILLLTVLTVSGLPNSESQRSRDPNYHVNLGQQIFI